MDYYCNTCDKSINHKPRNKHNKPKRHYFMKNYVTNIYKYNDIVWDDVEKILHENIISHSNKFNEFKIYVSCKIKDDVEIKVYKKNFELHMVVNPFVGDNTLYVHIAGKKICNFLREKVSSRYNIKCT